MSGEPYDVLPFTFRRNCAICQEALPEDVDDDVTVCGTCENTAREDRGLEPLPDVPW